MNIILFVCSIIYVLYHDQIEKCNAGLEGIISSMREAFRVCDLKMAPYFETAREFCDVDGGTMTGGGGGTNAEAGSDGM